MVVNVHQSLAVVLVAAEAMEVSGSQLKWCSIINNGLCLSNSSATDDTWSYLFSVSCGLFHEGDHQEGEEDEEKKDEGEDEFSHAGDISCDSEIVPIDQRWLNSSVHSQPSSL